jgi:pilus assembly protein CpaB
MRNRIFAVLALAILAGGGLAYATYSFMQNQPANAVAAPTQPVVVAAADLRLGSELKQDDLRVINFPEGQAPEGSFSQAEQVLGRGVIVPIVKNEPILNAKLASKEAGSGLPPVIPEGMRAVSVRVDEVIGVAGYVLPGTRVDLLATASQTNQSSEPISKVVLSNVQVLTAGTRMEQDQDNGGKPMAVTVVTLLVKPDQAERVALASTEGKIQLALRNPLDTGSPETPGMKTSVLMSSARSVAPAGPRQLTHRAKSAGATVTMPQTPAAPVPAPAPSVEMIRGDKRATEVIK